MADASCGPPRLEPGSFGRKGLLIPNECGHPGQRLALFPAGEDRQEEQEDVQYVQEDGRVRRRRSRPWSALAGALVIPRREGAFAAGRRGPRWFSR